MKPQPKIATSTLFVLLAIAALYFLQHYYPRLHPLSQTNFKISARQVIDEIKNYLPPDIQSDNLRSTNRFIVKKGFLKTEQTLRENAPELLELNPRRYWDISLVSEKSKRSTNMVSSGQETTQIMSDSVGIFARISPSGKLLFLDFQNLFLQTHRGSLPLAPLPEETKDQPFRTAKDRALQFINRVVKDTTGLSLYRRAVEADSNRRIFKFSFTENHGTIPVYHTVKIISGQAVYYRLSFNQSQFEQKLSTAQKINRYALDVLKGVIFVILLTFLIISFFRLTRKEAMSLRIAFPIMFFILSVRLIFTVLESWNLGWLFLLGGVVSNLITGAVGILFLYAISDAFTRQVWSDKLKVTDLFHRGKFVTALSAQAVLQGILLGLFSLTGYIVMLFVFSKLFKQELALNTGLNYSTTLLFPALVILLKSLDASIFNEYFIRLFGLSLLKKWLGRNRWVVFTGAVALVFFTSDLEMVNSFPRFFTLLVPSLLFAIALVRFEVVSVIVGLFSYRVFSRAVIFTATGEPYFRQIGIELYLALGILLFAGIIVLLLKRGGEEEEARFVPEYIRKQEERQRLLRELEIARTVQRQFLPKSTPEINGYQIAAACQPAWEVGGDYYDFFPMPDGKLGLVIGDVSNKGISAAFFMTLVKGFLKALSGNYASPAEILRQTNRLFYQNVERGHFVSMIYGVLNPAKGDFVFARAGHNPLLYVLGKNSQTEWKTPPGIGIGLVDDAQFTPTLQEEKIRLKPGDLVVLYTDGYSEAMNTELEEFGEEQLKQLIREQKDKPAGEIIRALETAISRWEGKQPALDDKTIVVLKRLMQ